MTHEPSTLTKPKPPFAGEHRGVCESPGCRRLPKVVRRYYVREADGPRWVCEACANRLADTAGLEAWARVKAARQD